MWLLSSSIVRFSCTTNGCDRTCGSARTPEAHYVAATSSEFEQGDNRRSPFAKCLQIAPLPPLLFSDIDLFHLDERRRGEWHGGLVRWENDARPGSCEIRRRENVSQTGYHRFQHDLLGCFQNYLNRYKTMNKTHLELCREQKKRINRDAFPITDFKNISNLEIKHLVIEQCFYAP